MKNRLLKTFTSLVLTVLMVLSIMPAFAITIGAEGGTYKLVTDASTLAVGDKVIIVATGSNDAISTTGTNNRRSTSIIKNDDGTIKNISANVQVFTLEEGTTNGTFAFNTGSGYIYAASSGNNYLKTQTTNNANGSWTITITSTGVATITAQGSNTRNLLKYNSTSSLFSCYASGQKDVSIYKLATNTEETTTEGGTGIEGSGTDTPVTPVDCPHTNTVDVPEVPATCTTPGTTAGEQCTNCGAITSGCEPIPATGVHTYKNGVCTGCGALNPDPANIVNKAYELASGATLSGGPYTLTGTITKIDTAYSTQYKNISVTIVVDGADAEKPILCYRLKDGTYNGVANLAVNDKITVKGTIKNYNGTVEFDQNCTLEAFVECPHTNTVKIDEAKDATCTENGITAGKKCTDCDRTLEEQTVLNATGHKDENGDSKCDTCGATICTEHIWIDGEVKVEGDCTTDEVVAQVCQNCGEVGEDRVTTASGHTEAIDAAVAATCTATGKTEGKHCSVCNEILVAQTTVGKIDHNFENGTCTMCGKVLPFKVGDIVIFTGSKADGTDTRELTGFESDKTYGTATQYTGTPAGSFPLTIVNGYQSGTFAFKNGDNYITCYGDKNVNLSTTVDVNSSWNVSLDEDDNLVLVSCSSTDTTKYYLQYNSGNPRFTTYSTGSQQPIKIVKVEPAVESVSLSLNKGVTVKVKINIPEAWLTANAGAKVVFSNDVSLDAKAGENVYSVDLTPAQINDALTVKLTDAEGNTILVAEKDVSVSAYKAKAEATGASKQLIDLLDAALTYSNAADGAIEGELTNDFAGVDNHTVVHTNEEAKLFTDFSGQLGTYASIYINVNTENVPDGETLVLKVGGTGIINDDIAKYITKDGQIVITGLFPANFDDTIYIEASTEGSNATFTFNSYLKAIYNDNSSTQRVKNLAVATYLYGLAAEAYLATLQ